MSILLKNLPNEYSTIYDSLFSPNGDHLVVANDFGKIGVYFIEAILSQRSDCQINKKKDCDYKFIASNSIIYSLVSTGTHLLTGGIGEIKAWLWKDVLNKSKAIKSEIKAQWSIKLQYLEGTTLPSEINSMYFLENQGTAGHLIIGSGSNDIRIYDLETREEIQTLKGHSNYIHSISYSSKSSLIASGSEDGSVRLWDNRKKSPQTGILEPYKKGSLARTKLGKYISSVDIDSDWIVCGGGPLAALWHLTSMSPSDPLPPSESGVTVLKLLEERILIGGLKNKVYHTDYNGHILAEVETSSSVIYSIVCQEEPTKLLAMTGSSSVIDLCAPNFSYKDRSIYFDADL